MDAIQKDIQEIHNLEKHNGDNKIRKKQIGSGQRGDKIRTYRFQDDVVTDHVTGKTIKASKIMRGNFNLLWND